MQSLAGHAGAVTALALLQNGYLASASYDFKIKIWNTLDGVSIRTFDAHYTYIGTLSVLKNGDLVSGSIDKSIIIWDSNNGFLKKKTLIGHSQEVVSIVELENGYLASGGKDGKIIIWDAYNGSLIRTLTSKIGVNSLTVLPNGNLANGFNIFLEIWNTNTYKLIKTINGTTSFDSLLFISNGYLVVGGNEIQILHWQSGYILNSKQLDNLANSYFTYLTEVKNGYFSSAAGYGSLVNILKLDFSNKNTSEISTPLDPSTTSAIATTIIPSFCNLKILYHIILLYHS